MGKVTVIALCCLVDEPDVIIWRSNMRAREVSCLDRGTSKSHNLYFVFLRMDNFFYDAEVRCQAGFFFI